jgi:hypothetical protein
MTSERGSRILAASTATTSDVGEVDRALDELALAAPRWAQLAVAEKIRLLDRLIEDTAAVAGEWNAAACDAKGLDAAGPSGGEELLSGISSFVRVALTLRSSLRDIAVGGRPKYPGPVHHHARDRISIGVLPTSLLDRVLYTGLEGEVWFQSGLTEADVRASQALAYQDPTAHQGVSAVLGAGNVASLGPRDVLDKLFVRGRVVLLKSNPVNDYLVPFWRRAMAGLIDAGFLRIVSGDAGVGSYIVHHPLVADLHVTGSDKTHDAIVYGTGPEGARRKADDDPVVSKPLSCELGNVSPVVIVPGEWTPKELRYQAAHVATMLTNNAGFNCLTPRVLVTASGWPQREDFLRELGAVLAKVPTRLAYYPGASSRWEEFVTHYPHARRFGAPADGELPWTLIAGVDASQRDDLVFNVEAFCSLMAETSLTADSAEEFLDQATAFCNEVVWGTLSMTILVDPRSMKRPAVAAALERAVSDLRYGSIGVNAWHAMSFLAGTTTWGAYPGHPRTDIQSGSGVVGNASMFEGVEKSVVRGPFVAFPPPAWFVTNPHGGDVLARLFAVQTGRGWAGVPGLLRAVLRK